MTFQSKDAASKARHEFTKLIRDLVQAEIDESWSGAGPPEDMKGIEADLRMARMDMREALDKLFPGSTRAEGRDY